MGIHVIRMPDIGEGIAEVELVEWHVKPGDAVTEDQTLADVMTDKASVEIPAPVAGTVLALGGKPGDVMAVGSELIRIEVDGEGNEQGRSPERASPATVEPRAPGNAGTANGTRAKPHIPAKAVSTIAKATPSASDAGPAQADAAARPDDDRRSGPILAAPAVRRRAADLGIDLHSISGSGPDGRIVHADLDAQSRSGAAPPSPPAPPAPARSGGAASAPPAPVPPAPTAPARSGGAASAPRAPAPPTSAPPTSTRNADAQAVERSDEETVQIIGLRRKIAQKMQESKRRIPHFTYVEEVDVTELEALRARLNTQWAGSRGRLTFLPFLMRAIVRTAPQFPQVNARFDDEAGALTRYGAVHIGIATQTEAGLMVPVVRHAEARDLWSSAAEVARLAEVARAGKATRDELSGSTITITSLGPLGGIVTTPVINHPEVAIVGVNRMVERPVIRNGAIVPRLMMNLSSSFDHRVVDGMVGAEFVQALRGCLEHPATMFIE